MKKSTCLFPVQNSALARGVALLALALAPSANVLAQPVQLEFDTELLSLNLTGGPFPIPLASDPGNALGDSIDGYGFVSSLVSVTLSSQRNPEGPASLGKAQAFNGLQESTLLASAQPQPIDPNALDGQRFVVQSFFDVFFDITVTDVDSRSGRNYAGQPDGASFLLRDNGPANLQNSFPILFDKDAPNFGLIPPPESAPYIGHINIEIPLGADINGNGENDKIKFTLATDTVGDENRTFIILPDGTVIDNFDSTASLEGLIVDESADPPFSFSLTGPTSASSRLLNPIGTPAPEGGAPWLMLGGSLLGLVSCGRWFGRRRD